jgi:type II secretory pathway component PulK
MYILNRSRKGVALFIAVALLFLLSVTIAVVLLSAYNYANISEKQIQRSRAIKMAEAGISYAYWKIRIGQDDYGDPIVYPCVLTPPITLPLGWSIRVDVSDDPSTGKKTINSSVSY